VITKRWQVQEAKAKFSALIGEALGGEPQAITRHGRDVAVVVPADEYARLTKRSNETLLELLSNPDWRDLEIPERDPTDFVREIEF
jgi:prevent-host-death family protein